MKDVGLLKFDTPNNFIDLRNMVKLHAEQDVLWTEELAKIADAKPGKLRQFREHPIKAQTTLQ
jgi:hypothetical protein